MWIPIRILSPGSFRITIVQLLSYLCHENCLFHENIVQTVFSTITDPPNASWRPANAFQRNVTSAVDTTNRINTNLERSEIIDSDRPGGMREAL